jgi:quercetin dioxygenase-like cupin family protein
MKVVKTSKLRKNRVVECPNGGFTSHRILTEIDGMGFGLHKTVIPKGKRQFWHYKNHLESCYCISGKGVLTNKKTKETFNIVPDTTYVLDKNDAHYFKAIEEVTLLCVFNPPLQGKETHQKDGSYSVDEDCIKVSGKSPVYNVLRVHVSKVVSNDYNPNSVAPPEMALLETSIWEDGYTQPIVTVYDKVKKVYIVVDGFHRYRTMIDSKRIKKRENGYLPIVVLDKEIGDRMASTIRHNRARGSHNIELMSTIVSELVEMGKGDHWICKHIGMSKDELLRMKQVTGLAALFNNKDFSKSWEAEVE